jgi:hypothetical protein
MTDLGPEAKRRAQMAAFRRFEAGTTSGVFVDHLEEQLHG